MKRNSKLTFHTIVLCVLGSTTMAQAESSLSKGDGDPILPWSRLQYSAKALFVSLELDVHLQHILRDEAQKRLIPSTASCAIPEDILNLVELGVTTEVLGRHTETSTIMTSDSSVIQNSALRSGNKNRQRSFRYCADEIVVQKRRPLSRDEEKRNWSEWSDVREMSLQSQTLAPAPITEAEALFYRLAMLDAPELGDTLHLYFYEKGRVTDLSASVSGRKSVRVRFKERTLSGTVKVKQSINALVIEISARPYGEETNSKSDSLGFKGDWVAYYDPERHVILEMVGKVDYLGTIHIKLDRLDKR
ncbi:hypothetical protein AZF00_08800 [Zhongshania aliphaticivorans]|uniref:DUF3108 domain-containing protein n=2 Tax=Zhongshania aliphaticivorans TaxID=1470434 RepID=A0A127M556_9GAMM|nr:hypothetical protein AZF00_08800 [Zhongshania aliphaticivorans]